jgi:hypothetical protein
MKHTSVTEVYCYVAMPLQGAFSWRPGYRGIGGGNSEIMVDIYNIKLDKS